MMLLSKFRDERERSNSKFFLERRCISWTK